VTVNQKNGRSERVFVNLERLYPTPNVNGSELCFEELMAGHRGWLNKVWKPETSARANGSLPSRQTKEEANVSDNISREVSDKLVILDENGAAKENGRQGKGRRMKIKEVNETQISMQLKD
jgi:checkpoint serine/threonine-protein kinase